MILNKDIHECDELENTLNHKMHTLWEWIKRIPYVLDAKLFERKYKDDCDYLVKENQRLKIEIKSANKRRDLAVQYAKITLRRMKELERKGIENEEEKIQ